MEMLERCLIVGCNGQFGRIFARKLAGEGIRVAGLDQQPSCQDQDILTDYVQASVLEPNAHAQQLISWADCLLLCIPEATTISAIPVLAASASSNTVIIDIASVKSRIEVTVHQCPHPIGYLSIHPMFGPTADFASKNISITPLRENAQAASFIDLLIRWQANLTRISATDHDRNTAYIQALVHAMILLLAWTEAKSNIPYEVLNNLATPPQRTLFALAARLVSGDPELYWNIQTDNPYAHDVRNQLQRSLTSFSAAVDAGQIDVMRELFRDISTFFGPDLSGLADLAARIVATETLA